MIIESGAPNASFSDFEQTEFKLHRIRAPNFGVRHNFGVRLEADRI